MSLRQSAEEIHLILFKEIEDLVDSLGKPNEDKDLEILAQITTLTGFANKLTLSETYWDRLKILLKKAYLVTDEKIETLRDIKKDLEEK